MQLIGYVRLSKQIYSNISLVPKPLKGSVADKEIQNKLSLPTLKEKTLSGNIAAYLDITTGIRAHNSAEPTNIDRQINNMLVTQHVQKKNNKKDMQPTVINIPQCCCEIQSKKARCHFQ